MSLLVGDIVLSARESNPEIPGHIIASALSVISGGIICFLGLIRCGWIVEVISLSSVCSFVTGAAFTIACGQVCSATADSALCNNSDADDSKVPKLMGITGFSTRDGAYLSVIRTLKHLPDTKLDAALGLTALLMLYLIRSGFNYLARRQPHRQKTWFFCNTLRTAFVILLYTLISWLMNLHLRDHDSDLSPISIIGEVPRGFQVTEKPRVTGEIVSIFANKLPATVIVLLIEHISIAKSFGRVNGYSINPSQEMVAIGVTNLLGPFLGSYPATGSFSRTAIKAKAGVRTPLAGVISAAVVLLAIYALTAVFFYIPNAALAAVIIHAVLDLLTPPKELYQFWKASPPDAIIFVIGVFIIVFTTVEYGIYVTVSLSAAVLFWRLFKAKGKFVGPVSARMVTGEALGVLGPTSTHGQGEKVGESHFTKSENIDQRTLYLPLDHSDQSNPGINARQPFPGVFIYRFSEELCYLNASRYLDDLAQMILSETRMTAPNTRAKKGDLQWNDTRRNRYNADNDPRPKLKAIVLDFSSVHNLDISTVQAFVDVRAQLNRHTAPYQASWYFSSVNSPWAKRALSVAGFDDGPGEEAAVLSAGTYTIASIESERDSMPTEESTAHTSASAPDELGDLEANLQEKAHDGQAKLSGERFGTIMGVNWTSFYPDLQSACHRAMVDAQVSE